VHDDDLEQVLTALGVFDAAKAGRTAARCAASPSTWTIFTQCSRAAGTSRSRATSQSASSSCSYISKGVRMVPDSKTLRGIGVIGVLVFLLVYFPMKP
jgi:hypothetical protein